MAYENVILVIIAMGALFFGAKRLPELARSLGRAQAEFEKAKLEARRDDVGSYGNNENKNDSHANTLLRREGNGVSTSVSEGADTAKTGENTAHVTTTAATAISESASSSLVVTAGTDNNNNNNNNIVGRAKLENAARKIGIENPEKLSDDELRSLIRNNLGL